MKTLIIEDELPAARQLAKLLTQIDPSVKIIETLDSIEAAVAWLRTFPMPDVVFMDIQIADGLSFDIFSQVAITCPIVFTTAFDQYAVRAFKVHAVDYLLKPIDETELANTLSRLQNLKQVPSPLRSKESYGQYPTDFFQELASQLSQSNVLHQRNPFGQYKTRFLVKTGQSFATIETSEIAYFFSEEGVTQMACFSKKKHVLEISLNELERQIDPSQFFRISRNLILNLKSIAKISPHFNSRLKLELTPPYASDVFVARERVNDFKTWLGG
jgi:two-component system LytT family response regulator